jgi:hypothetical protein
MAKNKKLLVSFVLLGLLAAAVFWSWRGPSVQIASGGKAGLQRIHGLVSVDTEAFFLDERVRQALAEKGIEVQVQRVGSRDMAAKVQPGQMPDFFLTSGVVSGNQIADAARKAQITVSSSSPFFSPLVIASWRPVVDTLTAHGLARGLGERTYGLDMAPFTQLMLERKRWNELKGSQSYPVARSVLVSTTDLRRSNSAAMYLALTSHALLGEVVSSREQADTTARRLAGLFSRQGYQENYVNGNFEDYLNLGPGKTPLAFIYEYQMVSHARSKGSLASDMVLIYPLPTILNKQVMVSASELGKTLAQWLANDPKLQGLAMDHGFRTADVEGFMKRVQGSGLKVEPRVTQVVDPPSFERMSEMIDVVLQEMSQ